MKKLFILALLLAGCASEQSKEPEQICDDIGGGVILCHLKESREPREPREPHHGHLDLGEGE